MTMTMTKIHTKTNTVPCLPSMFLAKNIVQDNNDKYTDKDKYGPVFAFHVFDKENVHKKCSNDNKGIV